MANPGEKMFLTGCHDAWVKSLAEAKEKGDEGAVRLAESKIKGVRKAYKEASGEELPTATPAAAAAPAPPASPPPPAHLARPPPPAPMPDPPTIEALLEHHAWLSKCLQDDHDQEMADIRAGVQSRWTIGDDLEISQAYNELEDLEKQYKELTGMDMPGTVREGDTVPVTPDAPSQVFLLDLYPTGSEGNGLPMCVMAKLVEHIKNRDPADSGVDLPTPATQVIPPHTTVRIKLGIRATVRLALTYPNHITQKREGLVGGAAHRRPYWLVPRSSVSKTPLILANSIGVIDAGYNGELMAAFHNTSDKPYEVKQFDRLVQIVSGDLKPFYRITVRGPQERPDQTRRGDGGYGSTGK
jgi:dUTP pyrophosphatase